MQYTQDEALQQSPILAEAGEAPNSASNPRPIKGKEALSTNSTIQEPGDGNSGQTRDSNTGQSQAPTPELSFNQILEQQIAQAIQPVLDEFRQNVAKSMEQQRESLTSPTTSLGDGGASAETNQRQGTQQSAQQQGGSAVEHQAQSQQSQPEQQSAQQTGSSAQSSAQPESHDKQGQHISVTGALRPALQTVERHSEQWLQSMLVAGLTALLTESTHAAIQQRAEGGLHTLLQKLFEAAPNGVINQEMLDKIERTLQTILRESLDAVFVGAVRSTVQQSGQQAIQESLHGDFGGALRKVEDTLKAMGEALIMVLRQQRQSVIRLMIALALLAFESSLAPSSTVKDK